MIIVFIDDIHVEVGEASCVCIIKLVSYGVTSSSIVVDVTRPCTNHGGTGVCHSGTAEVGNGSLSFLIQEGVRINLALGLLFLFLLALKSRIECHCL